MTNGEQTTMSEMLYTAARYERKSAKAARRRATQLQNTVHQSKEKAARYRRETARLKEELAREHDRLRGRIQRGVQHGEKLAREIAKQQRLLCLICYDAPDMATQCGHLYCHCCFETWRSASARQSGTLLCAACRRDVSDNGACVTFRMV